MVLTLRSLVRSGRRKLEGGNCKGRGSTPIIARVRQHFWSVSLCWSIFHGGQRYKYATMLIYLTISVVLLLCPVTVGFSLDTKVRVRGSWSLPVPTPSNGLVDSSVQLSKYMTLPVEQYALVPMPLNSTLSRIPGGTTSDFELVVPPLNFLWLEVQPVVEAKVNLEPDRVVITSEKCTLSGSPFLSKVRLNDRFDFRVRAELTWNDTALVSRGTDEGNEEDDTVVSAPERSISAETWIEVDVDTPMPFRAIPKRAIEKTGNTAMALSMNYVLRSFMRGLVKDYSRWAEDPAYRKFRSELARGDPVAFVTPERALASR